MSPPELRSLGDAPYRSRVIDEKRLRDATDEAPFEHEAFDALEELLQSVELVASIAYRDSCGRARAMTRNEAIEAGLMTRCAKLQKGLLDPGIKTRMELFSVLWRSTVETAVNSIYLARCGTPDLFDAYVSYSLRLEKRLLARVQRDVEQQDGGILPIQERMLKDLPRAFDLASVSVEEINEDNRSDWSGRSGIYGRFKAIGWRDLYPLFSIGSHYLHGNWHDLSVHHLARDSAGGFFGAPEFTPVPCQPITVATKILASAVGTYLTSKVAPSEARDTLEDRIGFCGFKAETIDELHEGFKARSLSV